MAVKDIPADVLIEKIKERLKKTKEIKAPEWAKYVKTGMNAERPPEQEDFWYIRASALLRKIYLHGPIGVQRLRSLFGGMRRRGHRPGHHYKAGGKMIRLMLQQLEKEGFIKKDDKKKGRVITPKGQKMLDKLSSK